MTAILCLAILSAPDGRAIYQEHCASCHGEQGAGVDGAYQRELVGDKSVKELSRYLDQTMPEGSPGDVTGADAEAVAAYVHDAFYSPVAQERLRPPRVQLARLTNRQWRQSVADLVMHHEWRPEEINPWGRPEEKSGVETTIIDGGDWKDPPVKTALAVMDLEFGTAGPTAEDFELKREFKKDKYRIQWSGTILAPDTGTYEFVLDTNGSAVMSFNGQDNFIDAKVRSGEGTETRATVDLLAGQGYSFWLHATLPRPDGLSEKERKKLERYYKNAAKGSRRPETEETYFARLKWVPPGGAEELVPPRCLSTRWHPKAFAPATSLPADDRSTGYARGSSLSEAWVDAVFRGAFEASRFVLKNADDLAHVQQNGKKKDSPEAREKKIRDWAITFAERAARRPLPDERKAELAALFDSHPDDPPAGAAAVVMAALSAPEFLYRESWSDGFDAYDVASWTSYALWDSVPDANILEGAEKGWVNGPDGLRDYVNTMMKAPRTKAKLRDFMHQWLRVDQFHDIAKDETLYPEFTEEVVADLRTSVDLFLDDILWGEEPTLDHLLSSEEIWLNESLARIYGGDINPDDVTAELKVGEDGWQKVRMTGQDRAGLLSHPYLMAGFSYDRTTSPIHRGVFISRSILGRLLKPPPVAVAPLAPDLHAGMTTRQRVVMQTEAATCQSCHAMINPLGFSLERFDALGRFREKEPTPDGKAKPIEAGGTYLTKEGEEVSFDGVRELAAWMVKSDEASWAFVEHLFHYTFKQPINAFGPDYAAELTERFNAGGHNIRELLADMVVTSAMKAREAAGRSVATK